MAETLPTLSSNLPVLPGNQEIAASGMAAQAKVMVEARYLMALHNRRNWDSVRQEIQLECNRPTFANNKSAWYVKPIGKGVEGLGIRFVEVALRCMKNVMPEMMMVHEDATKEIHRVSVTDLENNITYSQDVKVDKTVERAKPMSDGTYISVRKNSKGVETFTVPATDDEILNKRMALMSKALRTVGLRIIPGDIQDEAEATIKRIREQKIKEDPAGAKKAIIDSFAKLNVKVGMLVTYLGHPVDQCSPAQLSELRGLYGAIKDGESTWKEAMDNKMREGAETPVNIDIDPIKNGDDQTGAQEQPSPTGKQPITPGF